MAVQTFTVHGKLPSLNDYIHAMNRNRHVGNRLKRRVQADIGWSVRAAGVRRIAGRVDVDVLWCEGSRRRDPDNVMSSIKFILDTLVELQIIPDDSHRVIGEISHRISYDRTDPRVVITLKEVPNERHDR